MEILRRFITYMKKQPILAMLLIVAVLAAVFYACGGIGVYHPASAGEEQIRSAVSRLSAMEERPVPDIKAVQNPEPAGDDDVRDVDTASLQSVLLNHYGEYDYNAENFRRWFSDAAIVGDSLAYAIHGFEWVNESSVQAEVGISLYTCEDVIANTIWLQPSTIFLTFSANNILAYNEYVDSYITDYTAMIESLQAGVPGAEIYVQAVLQCDPTRREELWYYQYLDEYNSKMAQMCEELGVHFYDMNFIFDTHPDIFSEDGYHPMWPFYPLWLTYMAEIAGLTDIVIE